MSNFESHRELSPLDFVGNFADTQLFVLLDMADEDFEEW